MYGTIWTHGVIGACAYSARKNAWDWTKADLSHCQNIRVSNAGLWGLHLLWHGSRPWNTNIRKISKWTCYHGMVSCSLTFWEWSIGVLIHAVADRFSGLAQSVETTPFCGLVLVEGSSVVAHGMQKKSRMIQNKKNLYQVHQRPMGIYHRCGIQCYFITIKQLLWIVTIANHQCIKCLSDFCFMTTILFLYSCHNLHLLSAVS